MSIKQAVKNYKAKELELDAELDKIIKTIDNKIKDLCLLTDMSFGTGMGCAFVVTGINDKRFQNIDLSDFQTLKLVNNGHRQVMIDWDKENYYLESELKPHEYTALDSDLRKLKIDYLIDVWKPFFIEMEKLQSDLDKQYLLSWCNGFNNNNFTQENI